MWNFDVLIRKNPPYENMKIIFMLTLEKIVLLSQTLDETSNVPPQLSTGFQPVTPYAAKETGEAEVCLPATTCPPEAPCPDNAFHPEEVVSLRTSRQVVSSLPSTAPPPGNPNSTESSILASSPMRPAYHSSDSAVGASSFSTSEEGKTSSVIALDKMQFAQKIVNEIKVRLQFAQKSCDSKAISDVVQYLENSLEELDTSVTGQIYQELNKV